MAFLPGKNPLPKNPGGNNPTPNPIPTTPVPKSVVAVASSVIEEQERTLETPPGVVPFAFYSATNASGQMLRPGIAAAVSVDLPFRGSIVGLAVRCSAANSGTYTVHVDGTATEAAVVLSSDTNGLETYSKDSFEVADLQAVDVRITDESGGNPVEAVLYISVDPSTIL